MFAWLTVCLNNKVGLHDNKKIYQIVIACCIFSCTSIKAYLISTFIIALFHSVIEQPKHRIKTLNQPFWLHKPAAD